MENDFEGSRLIFERLFSTNMIEQELKGNILYWWGNHIMQKKIIKIQKNFLMIALPIQRLHDKKPSCFQTVFQINT